MSSTAGKDYEKKHGSDARVDVSIKEELHRRAKDDRLPCAVAFEIAKDLKRRPAEVGKSADLLNLRLNKCQLGLFGYQPNKKIVKPQEGANQELKDAIAGSLTEGKLTCKAAWDIASRFAVPKMTVSSACEAGGIKISTCQLGAF